MNNIPLAEDFLDEKTLGLKSLFNDEVHIPFEETIEILKDFAKAHTKAALEGVYKNANIEKYMTTPFGATYYRINYDSILNAYPLENIK